MSLDLGVLHSGLAEMAKDVTWPPDLLARFESWIRAADDDALFRINALVLARELELDEQRCIDLLVHATSLELFTMSWQLVCPTCAMIVKSLAHIDAIHANYECAFCQESYPVQLDETTEVVFSVSPQVRSLVHHAPERLDCEQLFLRHHFNLRAHAFDGRPLREVLVERALALEYLEPGARASWTLPSTPCMVELCDRVHEVGLRVSFDAEGPPPAPDRCIRAVLEHGRIAPTNLSLVPGPARLELENRSGRRAALLLLLFVPGKPILPAKLEPFLSCSRLLVHAGFRRRFEHELIGDVEGLAIGDLSIVFSDLSESTAMYSRLGDMAAYGLVQQHFAKIGSLVEARGGVIVKTIGDATMSCFTESGPALDAALAMREAFDQHDLRLKIGVHRGPVIAVRSNGRLDYFGQTVNLAARLQHLAEPDQICVSEALARDPQVHERLAALRVHARRSVLRGIDEPFEVRVIDR